MNESDLYKVYEKMGCQLEIRIDSNGKGHAKAEVRFLAGDASAALQVIGSLIDAGVKRVSEQDPYDEGEINLDEVDADDSDFGLKRKKYR